MTNRKLILRREHLTELSAADLVEVAGGATQPGTSCQCPSYSYMCITGVVICSRNTLCV